MRASLVTTALLVTMMVGAALAADSCLAQVTFRGRQDPYSSWTDYAGTTRYQIYDVVVANTGACPITSAVAFFSGGAGFISEGWNYDITSGAFSNFGAYLPAGESFFGAGFVLANSSQPTIAFTRFQCAADCSGPTSAPSTQTPTQTPSTQSPSTQAPSTQAPSTQAPSTQAPSTQAPSTTSSPSGCAVTAVITKDDYSWIDAQGRNNSVYRLTITNAGPCALKDYALSFGWGFTAELISMWNLEGTRGGYLVKGYGETLGAGRSYSAAGFILANGPADSIAAQPYGANCACSETK